MHRIGRSIAGTMAVMDDSRASRRTWLLAEARARGFALAGIAPAQASAHAAFFQQWLREGRHGTMQYLANHAAVRVDPGRLLPGARSILCVADRHVPPATTGPHGATYGASRAAAPAPGAAPASPSDAAAGETAGHALAPAAAPASDAAMGRIASYAWGDDYHHVIKKRLHDLADAMRQRWPEAVSRSTVDTAPIFEREHAANAGIGWVGKHTLVIHPTLGSWLLLGTIVTTLDVQTCAQAGGVGQPLELLGRGFEGCGSCTRCIDACPTHCIDSAGYHLDASRCISYLTLEHREAIDPGLHPLMADWLAGCDVCQQVCPFNHKAGSRPEQALASRGSGGAGAVGDAGVAEGAGDAGVAGGAGVAEVAEVAGGAGVAEVAFGEASHRPRTLPPVQPAYQPRVPPAPGLDLLAVLGWTAEDRQRVFRGSALKRVKLDMLRRNALIAGGNRLVQTPDSPLEARIRQIAANAREPAMVQATAQATLARIEAARSSARSPSPAPSPAPSPPRP